jgi:hypothetical protein
MPPPTDEMAGGQGGRGTGVGGAPFRRAWDVVRPTRAPRPDEVERIAEVRELAANHAALAPHERGPFLAEVRRLSTAKERVLAAIHTPPDHPAFRDLMALLDGLIAQEGGIGTPHGFVTRDELHESGARLRYEDGAQLLQFPIAWPWLVPPDPDRGIAGVRGEPVDRGPAERGPRRSTFRQVPEADPVGRRDAEASPWIAEDDEA